MKATEDIAFGKELRRRREAAYLSRADLAALASVSAPGIFLWESGALPVGRRSPALSRLLAALAELEGPRGEVDHG